MRIVIITAGAAGMYCGSCMRDNTLASALIELGHDALLIPTFTPITTDDADVSSKKIFLGGMNVYLQDRFWLFRHTPRFFDHLLNARWLLKFVSRFSSSTDYSSLGGMTISMLQGTVGHQRKEMIELIEWLKHLQPDVVILTNALLSGVIPAIRQAMSIPIITTLQGDDIFLDALPEQDRKQCLQLIRDHDSATSGYICTANSYADFMSRYIGIDRQKMQVVYPGIQPKGHLGPQTRDQNRPPTIGYFARIAPEKGFGNLVDAFIALKRKPGAEAFRLHYSGWLGKRNQSFYEEQLQKLQAAGLMDFTHYQESPDHVTKVQFLQSIDLLSVPTIYHESKGLYVLEAWANGVPVVQPAHGSFPELIESTGAGVLVPPGDPEALADTWLSLLRDEPRRLELGRRGYEAYQSRFTAREMAVQTLQAIHKLTGTEPRVTPAIAAS